METELTPAELLARYPIRTRYDLLLGMIDRLGGKRVKNYYYAVKQMPNEKAKRKVIAYAEKLGLADLSGLGTLRLAHKWNCLGWRRSEVYLHTMHEAASYGAEGPLLSLDIYHGSESEPTKTI